MVCLVGLRRLRAFAGLGTALVLLFAGTTSGVAAPGSTPTSPPTGAAASPPSGLPYLAANPLADPEVREFRQRIERLERRVAELAEGDTAPPWAAERHNRLDRRLERALALLEGLSARVETPVPRLDEPLTLLTVSLCTLILGFFAGRSLQRRGTRKDARFRL